MTTTTHSRTEARLAEQEVEHEQVKIWGLTAGDLHNAYWRARGIQCVRPGQAEAIDRAADLYLLLDLHQNVLFDITSVLEHLIWRNAAVTRLRLQQSVADQAYTEQIRTDASGRVVQVERNYRAVARTFRSVSLTSHPRLAERWRSEPDVASAKHAVHKSLTQAGLDRQIVEGRWFDIRDEEQSGMFLNELIHIWQDPDRAIEGIRETQKGVWQPVGEEGVQRTSLVGPIWLGYGESDPSEPCLVGPMWRSDRMYQVASTGRRRVAVRDMIDIESSNRARSQASGRQQGLYPIAKRAFDVCASALLLVLFSPLLLGIAIAIVVTDGWPIIYRQQRQTRGGVNFNCLKFRTMHRNAEQMVDQLSDMNLCDGPQVYIENDPRVTRVGAWLRRYQLDELPQLWNVLRGEMSLVGPRPSPDSENQYCPAWRELRLSVRPGITGLWQLKRTRLPGRDFQEWIRYDIEYVREASFWLDIQICYRTALMVLFGRQHDETE